MARLIIVSGPGAGTEHRLEGARVSIGRDPANAIVLEDSLVSKRHAEILREQDGSMRIVDVGSSNGTVVNDRQVVDHRLSHNDRIQLGESLFRFESEPEQEAVDEGAKTVLIDEAATRLAIPAEAVEAAQPRKPEPPPGDAVPLSTIYISDDESPAPAAEAAPPAGEAPGPGPSPRKKTQLPVMPILLVFITVMIAIGCLLTWKVVQRSGSAADSSPAVEPTIGADLADGLELEADIEEQPEAVEEDVAEEDLIAEPLESWTLDEQEPQVVDDTLGSQAVALPPATRTTTPPASGTTTPPATRTTTPQTTTPPATRSTTPPPATRTTYTPPPARPIEVPPTTTRTTTPAVVPPAAPTKPKEIVPDATHGVLHVITKPVGATIYVNEEMVGTSNVKKRMSAGKYIIRLEYQGQSINDDVKVKVQQVSTFYHDFSPPPAGERDEDEDDDDKDDDEDDDDEDDDDDDEDDDDEDDDDDDDDDKKKKKGFKKRLKDIFG